MSFPTKDATADFARGLAAGGGAVSVFAVVELVVSLATSRGPVTFVGVVGFIALGLALAGCLALVVAPLCGLLFAVPRLWLRRVRPERALAWGGLGSRGLSGAAPWVPWIWGSLLAVVVYVGASFLLTLDFSSRFKERSLVAATLALSQVALFAGAVAIALLAAATIRTASRGLEPWLGRANPFGRAIPAGLAIAILAGSVTTQVVRVMPALRHLVPWRDLLAIGVLVFGAVASARLLHARGSLLPAALRTRRGWRRAILATIVAFEILTLWRIGAEPEAKYLALTSSPPLARLVAVVRLANDFDGDGYGSLLGEGDCAPFNARIHPGARDVPGNGIDENCNGRDLTAKGEPSWRRAPRLPIPEGFRKDWNILLLTVDTLRYDHTGFGGYRARRSRDTTPRLDELVSRSTSFSQAQASSAGTTASIPAIHVSRYFHSGIALGPEGPPGPPKILPENVTLAEILQDAGYTTGAITTHEIFEGWGLEQGFSSFDNTIGMPPDPRRVTSHLATDKAIGWIESHPDKKWFLWVHYLDPHGHYVGHAGEAPFGTTEEDLYDGEIAFTDKHIGRLLAWLSRTGASDRTIVILTSDHGDGFKEHGFVNHGMTLFFELLHVPLVFYIPGLPHRLVEGPVSNIDIFPTVAAIAGVDISDLEIEGESLVPQLFHGLSAEDRVVFAETNYGDPLRAVVTSTHKLIYNLKANHYQLYDIKSDPRETVNIWGRDVSAGQRHKALLDEWLDRVYFNRDPGSQAHSVRLERHLLPARPDPRRLVDGRFGSGIRMIGVDVADSVVPGRDLDVTMYFEALEDGNPRLSIELELRASTGAGEPSNPVRIERPIAEGILPTSKWQRGDLVREKARAKVPAGWQRGTVSVRLRLLDEAGNPVSASGVNAIGADQVELAVVGLSPN